jgi:hypothetical protein
MKNEKMKKIGYMASNVTISLITGMCIAAVCQRINSLFFYNVFVGAFFSGLTSRLVFQITRKKNRTDLSFRPYIIIICTLLSFSFLSTVPLTIDRSYSVWLLKHVVEVEDSGVPADTKKLVEDSIKFFNASNGQLTRRIDEQTRIGNLQTNESGLVQITTKGKAVANINSIIGILFGLDAKYSRLVKF